MALRDEDDNVKRVTLMEPVPEFARIIPHPRWANNCSWFILGTRWGSVKLLRYNSGVFFFTLEWFLRGY